MAAADASTATTALGRSFSASMFDHDTGTLPQMVSNNEALMNIGHAMIESKLTVSEKLQGYMQQMLLLNNEQSQIQLDAASLWDSSQVLLTTSLNVPSVNTRCQLQPTLASVSASSLVPQAIPQTAAKSLQRTIAFACA